MQDRYFGDIGDFAKFGLLRAVVGGEPSLPLAVLWYMVPDEDHTNDGRDIAYLTPSAANRARFRGCDPVLYDSLGDLVRAGKRAVASVAGSGLLPLSTGYHDQPLTYGDVVSGERSGQRESWLSRALEVAGPASVVFLDPDNRLETSTDRLDVKGPKFAFYDDLALLRRAGGEETRATRTVIVYQHATRIGSFPYQIQGRFRALRDRLGCPPEALYALRWRRVSARAFVFAAGAPHGEVLQKRLRTLLAGPLGCTLRHDPTKLRRRCRTVGCNSQLRH